MTDKSQAVLTAESTITAVKKSLSEMGSAHAAILDNVSYLEGRAKRLIMPAQHLKDPAAQADLDKTNVDLAKARGLLADNEQQQAELNAELASAKLMLDATITAELVRRRDEAERAGVAAYIAWRELTLQAEIKRQTHGLKRAETNELTARLLTERHVQAQQHIEIPLIAAEATIPVFQKRLAELDAKLVAPGQYAPTRFLPKSAPATAPVATQPASQIGAMSIGEWREQVAAGGLPNVVYPRSQAPTNAPVHPVALDGLRPSDGG